MELVFRVLLYCVLAVLPSVLFLGLWRGLMYLRDDELVRAMEERGVVRTGDDGTLRPASPEAGTPGSSLIGNAAASVADLGDGETVVCEACEAPNLEGMRFCRNCLAELPDE